MGSSRFDRFTFFADLRRAEEDATASIAQLLVPSGGWHAAPGDFVPDWVFQNGERLLRIERALHASPDLALVMLGQRLKNIDLRQVWPILHGVLDDIALYLGGPIVLGGAIGAGIGFFAGGIGAVPGALAGGAAGAEAGTMLLSLLGLKSLLTYMLGSIPKAAEAYLHGFKMAWGPVAGDGHWNGDGSRSLHRSDFDCCAPPEFAAHAFARGHVIIVLALLTAIVAYLTSGRGDLPALLAEIRSSPRLGPKMAHWVEQNAAALENQPVLQSANKQGGLGEMGESAGGQTASGGRQAAAEGATGAGLRSIKQMLGQTEGGPGTWSLAPKRVKGEAYQEQVTGVARGIEYDVPYAGVPSGKVSFDGYDAERGVLLDAKDWKGYPPPGTKFWQEGLSEQARSQIKAANGMPIEWHFSTQESMDITQTFLKKAQLDGITPVLTAGQ